MIDTIAFRIPYSEGLVKQVYRSGSNITINYDPSHRVVNYKYLQSNESFGSFSRSINLFISGNMIKLEFSVPKYIFGHNVFMVYPEELEMVLYSLWSDLCRVYKADFPTPDKWTLLRLDICYNWKLPSQELAQETLNVLKKFSFPYKKTKMVYPTSVMFLGGRNHSFKFYLKQPEYYKHDFKVLKSNPITIKTAYNMFSVSSGVLRFEATLRSGFLESKFHNSAKTYHIFTNSDIITKLLKEFVSMSVNSLDTKFMSIDKGRQLLQKNYNPVKARMLLRFWVDLTTLDKDLFDFYYGDMDRSTIYRRKKDLQTAGLGSYLSFSTDDFKDCLDFSVPSVNCTNPPLLSVPAEAGAGESDFLTDNYKLDDFEFL